MNTLYGRTKRIFVFAMVSGFAVILPEISVSDQVRVNTHDIPASNLSTQSMFKPMTHAGVSVLSAVDCELKTGLELLRDGKSCAAVNALLAELCGGRGTAPLIEFISVRQRLAGRRCALFMALNRPGRLFEADIETGAVISQGAPHDAKDVKARYVSEQAGSARKKLGVEYYDARKEEINLQISLLYDATRDILNRDAVFELVLDGEYLGAVAGSGGDLCAQLDMFSGIMLTEKNGYAVIWHVINEGLMNSQVLGAGIKAEDAKLVTEFIGTYHRFSPLLFMMHRENKAHALEITRSVTSKTLKDEMGPAQMGEFRAALSRFKCLKADPEPGIEYKILGEIMQLIMPLAEPTPLQGACKEAQRRYFPGLYNPLWESLKKSEKSGDRRDTFLRNFEFTGGPVIQARQMRLKKGEVLSRTVKNTLAALRPVTGKDPDARFSTAQGVKKERLGVLLKKYMLDRSAANLREFIEACFTFISNDDMYRQTLWETQDASYESLSALYQQFMNEEGFVVPISQAIQHFPVDDVDNVTKTLNMAVRQDARRKGDPAATASSADINGLPHKLQEQLACFPFKIRNGVKNIDKEAVAAEIFRDIMTSIRDDMDKFEPDGPGQDVKLAFRAVKGIPHILWGYVSDTCIRNEHGLWMSDKYCLLEMYDSLSGKILGYAGLYDTEINGEKTLAVAGIQPSVACLASIDVKEIFPALEKALLRIKRSCGYERIYLPYPESDRISVMELAGERYGNQIKLPETAAWPGEHFQTADWAREINPGALPGQFTARPEIDMHLHSTYSDGTSSPRDIIDNAASLGLKAISITDHDTLEAYFAEPGLFEYAARKGVELVAGMEASSLCRFERKDGSPFFLDGYYFTDILAYFPRKAGESFTEYAGRVKQLESLYKYRSRFKISVFLSFTRVKNDYPGLGLTYRKLFDLGKEHDAKGGFTCQSYDYIYARLGASSEEDFWQKLQTADDDILKMTPKCFSEFAVSLDYIISRFKETGIEAPCGLTIGQFMGYILDNKDKYMGKPGVLWNIKDMADVIRFIRNNGGFAFFAHPFKQCQFMGREAFEDLVVQYQALGLEGIEAFSRGQSPDESGYFSGVAAQTGFLETNGSDFHGENVHEGRKMATGYGTGGNSTSVGMLESLRRSGMISRNILYVSDEELLAVPGTKDHGVRRHMRRVGDIALLIADVMGLPENTRNILRCVAYTHDAGRDLGTGYKELGIKGLDTDKEITGSFEDMMEKAAMLKGGPLDKSEADCLREIYYHGIDSAWLLKRHYYLPPEVDILVSGHSSYFRVLSLYMKSQDKLSISRQDLMAIYGILVVADTFESGNNKEKKERRGQSVEDIGGKLRSLDDLFRRWGMEDAAEDAYRVQFGPRDVLKRLLASGDARLTEIIRSARQSGPETGTFTGEEKKALLGLRDAYTRKDVADVTAGIREDIAVLKAGARYLKSYPVNVYLDMSGMPDAPGQAEENIRTLSRVIALQSSMGIDAAYILENDRDGAGLAMLKLELSRAAALSGLDAEKLVSRLRPRETVESGALDIYIRDINNIDMTRAVGSNEYFIALTGPGSKQDVYVPNFAGAVNMGMALAAMNIAGKGQASGHGQEYEALRTGVLKAFNVVFKEYGLIKEEGEFTVDELELMVNGSSDAKKYFTRYYALPPACKNPVEDLHVLHEAMQMALTYA